MMAGGASEDVPDSGLRQELEEARSRLQQERTALDSARAELVQTQNRLLEVLDECQSIRTRRLLDEAGRLDVVRQMPPAPTFQDALFSLLAATRSSRRDDKGDQFVLEHLTRTIQALETLGPSTIEMGGHTMHFLARRIAGIIAGQETVPTRADVSYSGEELCALGQRIIGVVQTFQGLERAASVRGQDQE